jgi:hypothetical protein
VCDVVEAVSLPGVGPELDGVVLFGLRGRVLPRRLAGEDGRRARGDARR